MLQIAGFLRQADKLVRERNYSSALEQIAKARAKDPNNSYAEAYEQRVQLLLSAMTSKLQAHSVSDRLDSSTARTYSQHLENISNLAVHEVCRNTGLDQHQQTGDKQQYDLRLESPQTPVRNSKDASGTSGGTENQVLCSIRSGEKLLLDRRFDEALNVLVPAILLDPLNEAILDLEHRIHDAREEDHLARLRKQREKDGSGHLTRQQGGGERPIMDREEHSENNQSVPLNVSKQGETRQRVFQYLDKAEEFLDGDRFFDALAQVALAIVAVQYGEKAKEIDVETPIKNEGIRRQSERPQDNPISADRRAEDDAGRIFALVDKAREFANKREFDFALEELHEASLLIPSDGSMDQVSREIAGRFVEYYQLMRIDKERRVIDQFDMPVQQHERARRRRMPVFGEASAEEQSPDPDSREHSTVQVSQEARFNGFPHGLADDVLSQIREHLLRCLHHLNDMKLIEASVEAEIAALVESSRHDVGSLALAVASLARKAKAQIPLDTLSAQFDSVRQQTMDLIHSLWYEELLGGLDRCLELLPASDILLARRKEIERSFAEWKGTMNRPKEQTGSPTTLPKKNAIDPRKVRKRPFNQMGLAFSEGPEGDEQHGELGPSDSSGPMQGIQIERPAQRGSMASSGSAFHGN